jgi:ABC-type antimicrobial peptide transport system permease subunit
MQEFGIRLALGASPADVTTMVVRQALRSVAIGGLIGILGSLGLARLLRAGHTDPMQSLRNQ